VILALLCAMCMKLGPNYGVGGASHSYDTICALIIQIMTLALYLYQGA